jgi:hypothetical protein
VKNKVTAREINNLGELVAGFAHTNKVTSVHAYKVCMRHLDTARFLTGDNRFTGLRNAHTHFQFLKAAAAEKATRGKA